ncbi:hypothetical protein Tco_1473944 [Tanacetum coccineum]
MHPNRGGLMMQMQRLPSLMRLQMMLETRTTRFQTAIRSEKVFGYILLMIKKLTQKKPDVNKVNIKFRGGLLGIKDSLMLGEECGFDSKEDKVVPKVDDVSLVDGVFDDALGGDGDEDFAKGDGEGVSSSSWVRSTKSFLGGIMVSLIFFRGLEEEA